jgi:EpsI family protein
VSTPTGTFNITTGCAGLHFFIVAFALGAYFSYQTFETRIEKITYTAIVVALAIIVNWIRVSTIIVAGYVTDMQHYLVTVDHYRFGWMLFVLAMVPAYILGKKIKQCGNRTVSVDAQYATTENSIEFRLSAVFLVVGLLAVVPAFGAILNQISVRAVTTDLALPAEVGRWARIEHSSSDWTPNFIGAAAEVSKSYIGEGQILTVYLNQYNLQSQGQELINDNNYLIDTARARVIRQVVIPVLTENGRAHSAQLLETREGSGRKMLTIFWYEVGTRRLLSGTSVKFQELKWRLVGRVGSGVVAIQISCEFDCVVQKSALIEFASELANVMDRQKLLSMVPSN